MKASNRYLGCLLGLAAGDALGTTLEFSAPGRFQPLDDMVGGGPFHLAPGEWTDDTSMALCLAESLIEKQGFDPTDQMERYVNWYRHGHLSHNGRCFDIGITTSQALQRFENSGEPFSMATESYRAGNGSLMRLAPAPMFFAQNPQMAIFYAGESSRTTHAATNAIDACRYFGGLLVGALHGASKEALLSDRYAPIPGYWNENPLTVEIELVARGSFKERCPPEIQGNGYVVRAMEAALWAFYRSDSYRQGCLMAVNLGDDADTTGAIYGQLAGAYYGIEGIPQAWLDQLAMRELIESYARRLLK
jgi:ADP-ribosyl-[dinitrogen reductase] hydrolase